MSDDKTLATTSTDQKVVALWCNECQAIKGPNGEHLLWGGKPSVRGYRCGVDYGSDLHSHFDVVPLVAAPDIGSSEAQS